MEIDISTVCFHPATFVICSHLPHCCLSLTNQILALLHSFLPCFPVFQQSFYPHQAAYFDLLVHFPLFPLLPAPYIHQPFIFLSVSLPHSLPGFLAFSMPSSAFTHGLVHLSVSRLSLGIWLFIPLLSPYLCMPSINTHMLRPHLYICVPSRLHVSLLLPSFFFTVFLQKVRFCLLSDFLKKIEKINHRKFRWPIFS